MVEKIWTLQLGSGPLIATAIHDGHDTRDEVTRHFALDKADRLREEDPFTGLWTEFAPTRLLGTKSRFQVDLNRPRGQAVYRTPADAWGLTVWKGNPSEEMFQRSLAEYDLFYDTMQTLLSEKVKQNGHFVVFDLHSYNHRRSGPAGPAADLEGNPQVNVGTGTMNRQLWGPVVDAFLRELRGFPFPGGNLDVRENVKFFGGNWPRWIHQNFPENGVAIAIEFKKFFMDEWTGQLNMECIEAIRDALESTVPAVVQALESVKSAN
ncbi:MAG: N-formylglutamate amidohydrolase [Gemmataceae bacterium]